MYILLILLAKICQDKKRAHFYKLSFRQVWCSLQLTYLGNEKYSV